MLISSLFSISLLSSLLSFGCADGAGRIWKTIVVDQSGHGDFTTVQSAVNSVPDGNRDWVRIHIKRGTYREKVTVASTKEHILLEGEGPKWTTIEWGDHASLLQSNSSVFFPQDTLSSATFTLSAANFVARGIQFVNTYNLGVGNPVKIAVAASIGGDKAAFYDCSFRGLQDTLCDYVGRHYFQNCWIEGCTDFIFGFGQSMYEKCILSTLAVNNKGTVGYITAQGRDDPRKPGGFVFKYTGVVGSGKAYLGRAYGRYSTVVFYKSYMSDVVTPEGWNAWNNKGHESQLIYAEDTCSGPGCNPAKRVKWEKKLPLSELKKYTSKTFIDNEGWLLQQPKQESHNTSFFSLKFVAASI